MATDLVTKDTTALASIRQNILKFQDALATLPDVYVGDSEQCPLRHSFAPGIYVREIYIPAGMLIVGKIHKHRHPNMLMMGEVIVYTESTGSQRLIAPVVMISEPGSKRVVYTLQETWWVTIHHNPTNTTDVGCLENDIIASTYEEFQAFVAGDIS